MDWDKVKLGGWSAAGGAVLAMLVGFNWGGWVTGGTADRIGERDRRKCRGQTFHAELCRAFQSGREERSKAQGIKAKDAWDGQKYVRSRAGRRYPAKNDPIAKSPKAVPKALWKLRLRL